MSQRVKAICSVTVTVRCSDVWGSDCTVDQVIKQASESAQGLVKRQLDGAPELAFVRVNKVTTYIESEEGKL